MFKRWLGEKVARDFYLDRKHCSIPHISFSISPNFRSRLDHPKICTNQLIVSALNGTMSFNDIFGSRAAYIPGKLSGYNGRHIPFKHRN